MTRAKAKQFVATVRAYQCPEHPHFKTLVLEEVPDSGGTRFGTGKCCPQQYKQELRAWRLDRGEAIEFIELLQRSIEEADRAAEDQ